MRAPLPDDEAARLAALRRYDVLDTRPEPAFERVARTAATAFRAPMAAVSFVDEHRQWLKARRGLEHAETPRGASLCAHTILAPEVLVVPDAGQDPRFADHPAVTGPGGIRFYAGAPLVSPDGHRLGTVCVADTEPRPRPSDEELHLLEDLAAVVVDELELRARLARDHKADLAARRLAAIVESSDDAIVGFALDGTVQTWNPGAERLYGWRAEEVTGRSISLLVPPDRPDEVPLLLDRIGRGSSVDPYETVRVRKDGRRVPVSLTISPIRDQGGEIVGASTIARDIGERQALQRELEAARNQAEAGARLKSQFLATMSHEIRTPMNGVIGMTGLLLGTELTAEQREYAEIVRASGEALLAVIDDILDFSKIEAGKLELEVVDFDLRDLVEQVAELLAEQAQRKGLELAALVEPETPWAVRGDPGRLRQVLLNLVGNAVKFTETGEVVVTVGTAHEDDVEVVVRGEVRDTGIGIAPEAQGRLFSSFSQVDGSTARRFGGTGLGLAICKQLVALMGGQIGVQSEPGVGSSFWFTVRLQRATPAAPVAPVAHEGLHGLHVLVVDDHPASRAALEHDLRAWRMRPGSAADAGEGLAALRAAAAGGDPYRIALVDVDMPGTDGLALAGRIRGDPLLSDLRLVLLTSHANRDRARRARPADVDACLNKPVSRSALYDGVTTLVGLEGVERPHRAFTGHAVAEARRATRATVLVVDDNLVNQKVAVKLLDSLGYGADVADDGAEAVAAVGRRRYDAVLMDCQMPGMDGYEATRRIRAMPAPARDTPVLAMTADVMAGDKERCLAAGMDDVVAKPIVLDDLVATLRRWVDGAPRPQPGGAPVRAPGAHPAPSGERASPPTMDPAALAWLCRTAPAGASGVGDLVELFLADAAAHLASLHEAVAADDAPATATLAHRLKGSSGNIGARQLSALCADLDRRARTGDLAEAGSLLAEAGAELERVRACLEERLVRRPPPA